MTSRPEPGYDVLDCATTLPIANDGATSASTEEATLSASEIPNGITAERPIGVDDGARDANDETNSAG